LNHLKMFCIWVWC